MGEAFNRISWLLNRHLQYGLEDAEKVEFEQWLAQSGRNRQLLAELEDNQLLASELAYYKELNAKAGNALSGIFEQSPEKKNIQLWPLRKMIAIAAALLLCITGAYIWDRVVHNNAVPQMAAQEADIAPGHSGAVLKLANGTAIVLDTISNGALAIQGNTQIVKQGNGQLLYTPQHGSTAGETFYNELSTPRGRKFRLILPDGSSVWLNAASSIRYPVQFAGNERKVDITGEAYFEIAHDAKKPFIVHAANAKDGADIQVLGTHFNVMAYANEEAIHTTLLEGSVKVTAGSAAGILKPGQQAQLYKTGKLTVVDDADTEKTIAWKNGYFSFKKDNIETVMKQVERWYDVDVVYASSIPQTFSGTIPADVNISAVCKILETTGSVHFKINGKKVTVTK